MFIIINTAHAFYTYQNFLGIATSKKKAKKMIKKYIKAESKASKQSLHDEIKSREQDVYTSFSIPNLPRDMHYIGIELVKVAPDTLFTDKYKKIFVGWNMRKNKPKFIKNY